MLEFEKQNDFASIKQELMDESVDNVLMSEEIDEDKEVEEVLSSLMEEMSLQTKSKLPEAIKTKQETKQNQTEEPNKELNEEEQSF